MAKVREIIGRVKDVMGEDGYREAVTKCLLLKNCAPFNYISEPPSFSEYYRILNSEKSLFGSNPEVNEIQLMAYSTVFNWTHGWIGIRKGIANTPSYLVNGVMDIGNLGVCFWKNAECQSALL